MVGRGAVLTLVLLVHVFSAKLVGGIIDPREGEADERQGRALRAPGACEHSWAESTGSALVGVCWRLRSCLFFRFF